MQRRRGRAGHEVSEQPARVRRAMLFLATLAVLLVQIHGATAASCRTTIAAGQYHTCAILDDTTVKCWGWNKNGQLGQGDTKNRGDLSKDEMGDTLPWLDLGNGRTALSVSAGFASTCAVLDDATLKCWGYNTNGELGQGDTSNRGDGTSEMGDKLPPVDLGVNRTAVSVSAGWYHTCAVLDDATVKCWGYNANGELGLGDDVSHGITINEMGEKLPAVELGDGRTAVSVSAGYYFTCAVLDDATVKCWGKNDNGQLGQGDTKKRGNGGEGSEMGNELAAVDLGNGRTAVSVSTGRDYACAVLDDATVKCWGHNDEGQLGLGNMEDRGDGNSAMGDELLPVDLGYGRTAVSVSAGFASTCALLDDATVKCWGRNDKGQLGLGDMEDRGDTGNEMGSNLAAVDLGSGSTAVRITSGANHQCALLNDATVKCWGYNANGELGQGDTSNRGDTINEMGARLPRVNVGTESTVPVCACLAGNYWMVDGASKSSTCTTCPAGSYSESSGAAECAVCPEGSYSAVLGASSSTTCTPCPAGSYSESSGVSECPACPVGSYSTEAGASSSATCTPCTAGSYSAAAGASNSSTCTPCAAGSYSESSGVAECTPCPVGSYSTEAGGVNSATCTLCPAGNFSKSSGVAGCAACPAGSYSETLGAAECTTCPAGSHSTAVGASNSTTCTSCPEESHSQSSGVAECPCPAGSYWKKVGASTSTICTLCPAGSYSASSGVAECAACPAGSYSAAVGASNSATCTPCSAGSYSTASGASTSSTCTPCLAGSYSSESGASNSTTCTLCPAGRYSASSGLAECAACTAGSYSAAAGASTSTACTPCLAGSYSPAASGTCTSCPEFASSAAGSATAADCECNAGYYASKDACLPTVVLVSATPEETSIISFVAAVKMSVPAFDVPAVRADYIAGVADALGLPASDVRVVSVVAAPGSRRASDSSMVETAVTVDADDAETVASGVTADNLNSALASRSITVAEVLGVKVSASGAASTTPRPEDSDATPMPAMLVGFISAGCVVVCVFGGVVAWYMNREGGSDAPGGLGKEGDPLPRGMVGDQGEVRGMVGYESSFDIPKPADGSNDSADHGIYPRADEGTPGEEESWNNFQIGIDINPINSFKLAKLPGDSLASCVTSSSLDATAWHASEPNPDMAPAGHDSNDSLRKRFQIATLQQIDGDIDDTEGEPTEESPRGSQGADNLARPGGDNLVGGVNLTSDNSASCSNIFGQLDPSTSWISNHHKFVAKALVLGHPAQAAEGLKEMLGLQNLTVFGNLLKQSVDAIESEFHQHGDRNDKENLRYCLYGKALDKEFMPRKVKLDIRNGIYHGGKLEEGEFDMGHEGMSLDDFVDQDRSKLGKLGREHVLALRLYTTSSFSLFNEPLRDRQESHPLRMTVYYLDEALRKLRAVRASLETKSFTSETILWRGMKDTVVIDPDKFRQEGGTELAPMSTTENKEVALRYANSERPLLFKFNAKGMSMGVDISFLSVYPKEREVLYPPLTYLMARGAPEMEGNVTIYSVEPSIS